MSNQEVLSKVAYSIEEFCQIVSLGRTGVFREIREKRLRVVKVGRRTLIPAFEVEDWLERMAKPAAPVLGVRL